MTRCRTTWFVRYQVVSIEKKRLNSVLHLHCSEFNFAFVAMKILFSNTKLNNTQACDYNIFENFCLILSDLRPLSSIAVASLS